MVSFSLNRSFVICSQIRELGGEYECFSMPYYDWTFDSGKERDPSILHSVFGGNGDPELSGQINASDPHTAFDDNAATPTA